MKRKLFKKKNTHIGNITPHSHPTPLKINNPKIQSSPGDKFNQIKLHIFI